MAEMDSRRDLLKLVSLVAGAGVPLLAMDNEQLPDKVVNADDAKVQRDTFGETRFFFEGRTPQLQSLTAGSLRLKPGMEPHPPHQHPEEEIMLVTEGNGEILVGGHTVKVGPGSMMYCEGGKLHGIKNTGAEPLLFYFYKWQK